MAENKLVKNKSPFSLDKKVAAEFSGKSKSTDGVVGVENLAKVSSTGAAAIPEPHYTGHRQRIKEKLLANGCESFSDYEMLEALLTVAIPRVDVKPLAKNLIATFGSFAKVIYAEPVQLAKISGIGENTIATFKIIQGTIVRTLKSDLAGKTVINNWENLLNYCLANISHENIEQFRVLYLNTKFHLIRDDLQERGTVNYASVYPREILKQAIALDATSVIIIHNHPSGDATPSVADVDITQKIKSAMAPLGIKVHDHIIFGKGGNFYSFKENGIL